MSRQGDDTLDAMTEDEIAGSTPANARGKPLPQKNAFSELMKPKVPSSSPPAKKPKLSAEASLNVIHGRDALIGYIKKPETFPKSRVVSYTDKYVAIHDLFPKSDVHMLLLPRDLTISLTHPFKAFEDAAFLTEVRAEVENIKTLLASELRRRHGRYSAQDTARNEALDAEDPPDKLPPGRDWSRELIAGVHAHPSMTHLHVHVMSRDRHSECLKHRKHYNSFSTPFFVPLDDLPLAEKDPRRHPGREGYLNADFVCWRCGANFGNKFKRLKEHLEEEFEAWRRV